MLSWALQAVGSTCVVPTAVDLRDRHAWFAETVEMEADCFASKPLHLVSRIADDFEAGEMKSGASTAAPKADLRKGLPCRWIDQPVRGEEARAVASVPEAPYGVRCALGPSR